MLHNRNNNDIDSDNNSDGYSNRSSERKRSRSRSSSKSDNNNSNNNDNNIVINGIQNDAVTIEKLWAKERYEMSYVDREASSYELHGVATRAVDETIEMISNSLRSFEEELCSMIPLLQNNNKKASAYELGIRMNSTYIRSPLFRLRFLRAELFDVKKAVERYCTCLDLLVEYFGEISLLRQLFLSDLSKDELKMLKDGDLQILPSRDVLGRRIIVFLGNVGSSYSLQIVNKVAIFLLFQILAEDVTTQRNGIVSVHLMCDEIHIRFRQNVIQQQVRFFKKVYSGQPCRWSGLHVYFPSDGLYGMLSPLVLYLAGELQRKVLRFHSGTQIECEYSLRSFGIPIVDIPTTHTGTIKLKNHGRFLKVRIIHDKFIKEQANDNYRNYYAPENQIMPFLKIQCPELHCVLFRKNGVAWEFPGNIKFRAFLLEIDNRIAENIQEQQQQQQRYIANTIASSLSSSVIMNREEHVEYLLKETNIRGFTFMLYDEKNHWYIKITEKDELRKQLASALRGHRKRRARSYRQLHDNNDKNNDNDNDNNNNDDTTMTDIDTVESNTFNSNSNSNSNSNCSTMVDVDIMIEPNPVVFTNMDEKKRTVCCQSIFSNESIKSMIH